MIIFKIWSLLQIGIYDNEYALIIDIYFYEYFPQSQTLSNCASNNLDTLSGILDKCLRFSLIKIEPVSISQAKPRLVAFLSSIVYTFLLK
jgi:hypothetical protein